MSAAPVISLTPRYSGAKGFPTTKLSEELRNLQRAQNDFFLRARAWVVVPMRGQSGTHSGKGSARSTVECVNGPTQRHWSTCSQNPTWNSNRRKRHGGAGGSAPVRPGSVVDELDIAEHRQV